MTADSQKHTGAYFTPPEVVRSLVRWAVESADDRFLDPSCGDGRFLALHQRSVGVEQEPGSSRIARQNAPWALVHERDFFTWAARTKERFECAAGNPPFIRYQRFAGPVRVAALGLCLKLGAPFSALTSSWAPFLVATASLLKPGGRMAFVVPAEIGHAPYARPLLEYLAAKFERVHVTAVRKKLFPDLSEDAWLLFAGGFGGHTNHFEFARLETFAFCERPPNAYVRINLEEWRRWSHRLRPFLASSQSLALYREVAIEPESYRLGDVAKVGIGYVTGANDFFHMRPSDAKVRGIDKRFLRVTVRNGKMLAGRSVTPTTVATWIRRDEPILLLRLPTDAELPGPIKDYLGSPEGEAAKQTYKCRNRDPWYVVPDVLVPDAFLSYMSGQVPALVANEAECVCTNSVHAVRLKADVSLDQIQQDWQQPLTELSCEIEGHPLGGGMLKVEPREASRIVISHRKWSATDEILLQQAVAELRSWRHAIA